MKNRRTTRRVVAWTLAFATMLSTITPSNLSVSAEETASTTEIVEEFTQEATSEELTSEVSSEEVTTEEVITEEVTSEKVTTTEDVTSEATTEGTTKEVPQEEVTEATTQETVKTEESKEISMDETSENENKDSREDGKGGSLLVKVSKGGTVKLTYEDGSVEVIEKDDKGIHSTKNGVDAYILDLQEGYYRVLQSEVDSLVKVEIASKADYKIETYSKKIDDGEEDILHYFEDSSLYKTSVNIENSSEIKLNISFTDDFIEIDEFKVLPSKFKGDLFTSAIFTNNDSSWSMKKDGKSLKKIIKGWIDSYGTTKASDRNKFQTELAKIIEKGKDSATVDWTTEGTTKGQIGNGRSATITITGKSFNGWKIYGASCCTHTAAVLPSGSSVKVKVRAVIKKTKSGNFTVDILAEAVKSSGYASGGNNDLGYTGTQNWRGLDDYDFESPDVKITISVDKLVDPLYNDWVGSADLSGAVFDIYVDDAKKTSITTGSTGIASVKIKGLDPTKKHKFAAKETKAPKGFILSNTLYEKSYAANTLEDGDLIELGTVLNVDGDEITGVQNTPQTFNLSWSLVKKDSVTGQKIEGAVYRLTYVPEDAGSDFETISKTVITDSNGTVNINMGYLFGVPQAIISIVGGTNYEILPGSFTLKEISAPEGYIVDPNEYVSTLDSNGNWSGWSSPTGNQLTNEGGNVYTCKENPMRGYVSIQKYGSDTETASPLLGYSFEGIQYTVYANETIQYAANGTWNKGDSTGYVLTCNKNGLAEWVDKANLNKMLPIGSYYIKETRGNAYYRNDDSNKYEFSITAKNLTPTTIQATGKNDTTARKGNTTPRVDINFTKYRSWRDTKYIRPLENIPFLITWEHDGVTESHIAVTNSEGKFDSSSFSGDAVVNVNDAVLGKGFSKEALIKTSELDNTHGVYFGKNSSNVGVPRVEGQGAIPVGVSTTGTITIQELWCENNANYENIYSCVITVGPNGDIKSNEYSNYSVKGDDWSDIMPENPLQNTIRNNPLNPTISSTATGKTTGTHMVALNNDEGVTTVTDNVVCGSLEIGHKYEIQGRLVNKATGEILQSNGEDVTQVEQFTAEKTDYTTDMEYTFDMSSYMGETCVVLLKLYDLSEAEYWGTEYYGDDFMMVEEASLDNEDQTVFIPGIETDAYDFVSEDHQIVPTIHDLVDARNENSSVDAFNKPSSSDTSSEDASKEDTTSGTNDTDVSGGANVSQQGDDTNTAKDANTDGTTDTENTESTDNTTPEDTKDTSTTVDSKVTATDLYVSEESMDVKDITFNVHDKVTMYNFIPGVKYYFRGKLIYILDGVKDTIATAGYDEELSYEVKNQEKDEFVVDFENVEIKDFNLNTGATFYVEEEVYYKNSNGDLVLLAEHKDPEDERQKLYLTGLWSVYNGDKNVANGNHQSAISEDGKAITLSDTLVLHNLCEGYTYKLTNEARFTDTGEVAVVDGKELSTTREITITKEMVEKSKTEDGYCEVFEYSVNTSALKGKTLAFGEYLSYKDNEINIHNRTNDAREQTRFPDVKTTAQDTITLTSMAALDSTVFVDKVELSNLQANTQQQVKGILMDKATGEYLGKDLGLEPITSECEVFTTAADDSQRNTTVEIKFTIPNSLVFAGKQAVVFEDLYTTIEGKQVKTSYHRDINDLGQTLTFVDEKTTATWENGTKLVNAEDKEFILNDVVHYTGLIPGKEYTQEGKLWQDDGNGNAVPFLVNGVQVTSSVVFTPETSEGDITIPFTINTKDLAGETIVVFEDLYYNGIKIATHSDLTDREQTVYVPKIGTTATDSKTGKKKMTLGDKVSLADVVEYSNLEENTKYTIKGKVIRKDNEKVIKENELTFTTTEASGTTEVEFKINTNDLQGKDLVVYEYVYDMQGNLVAMHEDIDDEGQTVSVPKESKVPRTLDTIMWLLLAGSAFIISGMWLFFKKKKNITE